MLPAAQALDQVIHQLTPSKDQPIQNEEAALRKLQVQGLGCRFESAGRLWVEVDMKGAPLRSKCRQQRPANAAGRLLSQLEPLATAVGRLLSQLVVPKWRWL